MQYVHKIKSMNSFISDLCAAQNVGRLESMPEKLVLVPLLRCNFNCKTCSQDHKDKRELSEVCMDKIEAVLPFVKMVNITGGEPLMYKHFTRLMQMLGRHSCEIMLGTNGSLLTERRREEILDNNVRWLKFSVDGGTPKAYNHIRAEGDFLKIMQKVGKMSELRITRGTRWPEIQFNFVALRSNIASLKNLVAMAAELGVSQINVIYSVCWNDELARDSLFFCQEYSNQQIALAVEMGRRLGVNIAAPKLFGDTQIKGQEASWLNAKTCTEPFKNLSFTVEGKSGICCGYGGRRGDLNTDTFEDIWNHPTWVHIRETVNTANESDICKKCTANKQDSNKIETHIPDKEIRERAIAFHAQDVRQAV